MDNKFNRIIEYKKQKGSIRKPKYATRKLSIGLVSCMLGYALLVSPSSVEAAELDSEKAVAEESAETETTSGENLEEENKEETPAEGSVEEETPAPAEEEKPAETTENTGAPTEKETTEEAVVEDKEAFSLTKDQRQALKEAGFTDSEIAEIEKEIANKLEADSSLNAQTLVDEKISEKTDTLGMSEEAKPEAVAAPSDENREPKDISNDVQSKYVALTEEGHETKGTIKPDNGEAVGWEVFFTSPKGTIAGDYFTIDLSDNLSLKGIEPDHEKEYPIEIDGKVVADGIRTGRSTIKYTFNENIKDQRNVVVSVKGFAYIDKTKVPNNTTDEKISIALGDTVDEHNINVQYGDPYYTGDKLNGVSQFTEFDPETGEYTQVFYINPDSKTITTSTRNWATGKVAAFIDGITPDGSKSDVNYTDKDTTVTVQKLPAGTKVPDAIIENPVETDEPTMVKTTFRDGGIEIVFADNSDDNLRSNNIDSPYIITVKSIAAPSKTGNNVYSRATFYGDGSKFHIMDNSIVTTKGDTEAQGDKIGYFIEHHVYKTKVDGVLQEDKTFTLHSNKMEGYDYNKYFTNKNVIDDFKFVKVDTDKLVENPVYNTDGTIARGNYEPGKTKEVTYIYERDITSGKFQEHHIYQTVDEKGNVLTTDDTVNKDETKGIDEDSYKTSKIDRDGYTLTEVKATNDESAKLGVKFDSKGAETTGNYVNGKKLEVTYIYQKQKPVEKKGSFQEHHIYQTKKLDGTIVKDDEVNKDVTEGTEKENYKTSKEDRDGYKLIEVKSVNGGQFNEDGSEKEAAYIADTKQEVTYIYQKEEVAKKGSFQEHHIYQTKKLDGTIVKDDEVNKDVTEGTEKENYKTSKEDRAGYKLIEVKSSNGGQFNEDGSEKEAAYIADTKQEVTYIYQKEEAKPWTPIEETGKFQEHHIYITKDKDGKEIGREVVDGKVSGGTKDMAYTTGKDEKDGFKFVRTEDAKENPSYDKDGKETTGNFKPGVTQEITYVYEKTESEWTPIEETGKFQEHHIYITKDKDGKEIKREVVDGKVSGGTKDMTYTTGKSEKDGFKFVRTEDAKENPSYDKDGKETTGNFKPGVTQEITYVYEKTESEWTPIEETGKFQEHHIYITKDKDGKEIGREVVDGKVSGGTKDMTYTTGKSEKDGFKFVRTENPVENPTFDEEGKTTEGKYRPGVKQEITYVYERTETPWTPLEPSEPVEPETPGETPDIPWTPLEPSEPVEPETPGETPDIPWTPLEPSEPVEPETPGETPETPEKPENPEKPETPETPDKPENPEKPETPETPKKPEKPGKSETSEDKKDNKVQVPVVEAKKEVRKETPTRKKGNPKTGVGSISGAALGLIAAASGLFVSKKNKDEE
ncbi:Ig-like domain-containing protein [Anaerococcus marasmi]|uniref:Ig-like domain-containing protein n=1 Tax=Anaerococcus marasmi TaxID=2057797 RepID=UPI000CF9877D|nr:Ig-like domain-containing protein [Anaerococcus marasmi]